MVEEATNWNKELNEKMLQHYVDEWVAFYRKQTRDGELATYIPELTKANRDALGIMIIGNNGLKIQSGNVNTPFTIQSISKVFAFIVACMEKGTAYVFDRVDVEPTGEAFNSIMHLQIKKAKKPFNPLVNSGAIAVTSMLEGETSDEKNAGLFNLYEKILGYRPKIAADVYQSEKKSAIRNRAIGYYLLEIGALESDLDVTLDAYFKQCAVMITVEDIAKFGLILANDGIDRETGEEVIPKEIARLAKVLMLTCGMYDASGKFAAYVGIPAKSGVAGGIMAAVPARAREEILPFLDGCGIGVYGPALDTEGNSIAGIRLLRHIASQWDFGIF